MPSPPSGVRDHLALALVPGLGPKLTRAVLERFGNPAAVLRATAADLRTVPLIGPGRAEEFARAFATVDVAAEWDLIERHQVRVLTPDDAEYPNRLTAIPDPPPLLYVKGELKPNDTNAVAIVGSRVCTSYGKKLAERMAAGLAAAGWTVISGLARGIDGAAHVGALEAGGRTIAVLAGGLRRIYPPEHADLAARVAAQGALLTETPMTVDPQPGMFPARNRIISGLCRGVVVVEANLKSGALITIDHATEQGREVFAVPGNVDSGPSAGCLDLIRKGARLVRSADDVLEDLQGISPPDPPPRATTTLFDPPPTVVGPPPGLDDFQRKVWESLTGPRYADDLTRELAIAAADLSVVLMKMEIKKAIRRLPGNQYERR